MSKSLSHGFQIGINNVTSTKIIKWRGVDVSNWNDFINYLKLNFDIPSFGCNWFKVKIFSDKHLNWFYLSVLRYNDVIYGKSSKVPLTDNQKNSENLYYKRSNLIQEMKQFCKSNNIKYFCDFCDYCGKNNVEWYNELCNSKQVINYMSKYLK